MPTTKVFYDADAETWQVGNTLYGVEQLPSGEWNRVWREDNATGTFKEGLPPYASKAMAQFKLKRLLKESGAIRGYDANVVVFNIPKGMTAKKVLRALSVRPK